MNHKDEKLGCVLDCWIEKKHFCRKLSQELLKDWQLQKIREIIVYGRKHSKFYQERFLEHSLPDSLQAFAQYPTMTESDVKRWGNRILCVSQGEISRVVSMETSGTSSEPKRIFFTQQDQELTVDFFHNGMKQLVKEGECTVIFLPFLKEDSVGNLLIRGLTRLGVSGIGIGIIRNLSEAVDKMMLHGAICAVGIPVQMMALAEYAQKKGIKLPIKRVLLSTDCLPEAIRKRIENCGIQVFNHFGMTECGLGVALECGFHQGMHIRENDLYIEILDDEGNLLSDGTWGELTVTTLTRKGMPMIRYRTGDKARIRKGFCSCGSILRRLDLVMERIGEPTAAGHTKAELDENLFSNGKIIDYQIKVYNREEVDLTLNLWEKLYPEEITKIKGMFGKTSLHLTQVIVKNTLPRYNGKRKIET